MTAKQYLSTIFLLATGCILTWVLQNILENRSIPLANINNPDSYMTGVTATRLNLKGQLQDELRSPLMIHYLKDDKTDLTTPHFIIYNEGTDNPPWNVYANYGQAQHGVDTIQLWDNVKLQQPAGPQNAAITMVTSAMTIYPQPQTAVTNQPVKVWQLGSVVNSVGLKANMKTGEIDLLSQARGKYQPTAQ